MQLSFTPHRSREPTPLSQEPAAHGTLAVEQGVIRATLPQGQGAYPTVEPGDHVRIFYEDRAVFQPTVIFHPERLRLEVVDDPPRVDIRVAVADDGLTATLRIDRAPGARYTIADHPPTRHLRVEAKVAEVLPPPPVGVEEIRAALEAAGVCYGLDEQAIQELAAASRAGDAWDVKEVVVARGDPPTPPRDAVVTLAEGVEDGALVEAGQLLATKTPAEPGKPGRSVRGTPIPPPPARDLPLRAVRAAELGPDGLTVRARRAGRVLIRGTTFEVQPVHRIPGDLGGAGVVVRFPGDVVVVGQVRAGAQILAGGKVEVAGGVDGARIEAAGSITVGGAAFRSTLVAGPEAIPAKGSLGALLERIEQELAALREMVVAVARQTGRSDRELAPLILERKGTALREALRALQTRPEGEELPQEVTALLLARLTGVGAASIDEPTLRGLVDLVRQARESLVEEDPSDAAIRVPYVHHAEVKASGRIQLTGRGSYQSRLWAGKGLQAPAGRLIGGEIVVAQGDVVVQTLGGPTARTSVSVGKDGRICAYSVMPDVIVHIGGRRLKVTRPYRMVCFHLQEGEIRIAPWNV